MEGIKNSIDHTRRLPFEILGKIFLYLGETPKGRIEELKKCRLVSPRWYKVVQDLFRDDFSQKLMTHYDGKNQNFTTSRTFGQNLFGSYRFNFPLLKISNAEYYLMKRWLENVTVGNNIQFLELKDNYLHMSELVPTLCAFQNVRAIKIVQSSENEKLTEKIRQINLVPESVPESDVPRNFERNQRNIRTNFLKNLKSIKFEIVHPSVLNYILYIIQFLSGSNSKLEHLSVKFDHYGLFKSAQNDIKRMEPKEMGIWTFLILKHESMSTSLKSLEFIVGTNIENYDLIPESYSTHSVINKVNCAISNSILDAFVYYENEFREIEHLVIDIPSINFFNYQNNTMHIEEFVRIQQNLKSIYLSFYHGSTFQSNRIQFVQEILQKIELESTFGFHISQIWPPFLTQLTDNLSVIHLIIEVDTTWNFSNEQVSIFPNCKEMEIKVFPPVHSMLWPDFQVGVIFQKFPNLETFKIRRIENGSDSDPESPSPQINHHDFQFILKNYTKLKHLYLTDCFRRASIYDSTFTGLTLEAQAHRLNNPDLILKPEEFEGTPISNLKRLEVLIVKDTFGNLDRITDISALFGFDQMPELKYLEIRGTEITKKGYSIIREKSGSENIETPYTGSNEYPKSYSYYARNSRPPVEWIVIGNYLFYTFRD